MTQRAGWKLRRSVMLALVLSATAAHAEWDTIGLGTGRSGSRSVTGIDTRINYYAQVMESLEPGDNAININGGSQGGTDFFGQGDLVMLLQTTGIETVPPSGTPGPIDLAPSNVGRWEFARIASVTDYRILHLTKPLISSFPARKTQVVRVPEYTSITINPGSTLVPMPWDGNIGGVLAFLVTGTVTNNGQINASGLGFRGGYYSGGGINLGCMSLDEPSPNGADKGEGLGFRFYESGQTGRGNTLNGGGGGICRYSGGGGGGNAGAGGLGGRTSVDDGGRSVGGLGGTQLVYSAIDRLLPGGGGGAGHVVNYGSSRGGRGGGIIFIRAGQIDGVGSILSNGFTSDQASYAGGGGGGAGGTIYLRLAGPAACGSVSARGAAGSNTNPSRYGPGGGGGGGRILLQSTVTNPCPISVTGGSPGTQTDPTDLYYGAQPGGSGTTTLIPSGLIEPTMSLTSPTDGQTLPSLRPPFTGTATPGATVYFVLADRQDSSNTQRYSTVANASGGGSLTPGSDLSEREYQLQVRAELYGLSTSVVTVNFRVDARAPETSILTPPPARTNARIITFSFSSNESPVSYECSLDGGNFTSCSNPVTFSNLSDGSHTLQVRARDATGTVDPTPASATWEIDTRAPETTIVSGPATLTSSSSATFDFSADDATATYECNLNSTSFAPCTDPVTFSGLGERTHTLAVRALDALGNRDATPETYTWTVSFASLPTPVVTTPAQGAYLATTTPIISGQATALSTVTVLINGSVAGTATASGSGAWTFTPSTLSERSHTLQARATYQGNTSPNSATVTFTIDLTAPDTVIVSAPPPVSNATSATFDFGSNESLVSYECKLDNGSLVACANPVTFTSLSEGSHTLSVRAKDAAGNIDTTFATHTWFIDITPPAAPVLQAPTNGAEFTGTTPAISGTALAGSLVRVFINDSSVGATTADDLGRWMLVPSSLLGSGTYTVYATVTDSANNASPRSNTNTFRILGGPVDTAIISSPRRHTNATSATFEFSSTETPATFQCALGAAAFSSCTAPYTITGLSAGEYTLQIRARDSRGNLDATPASYTWVVDLTSPQEPSLSGPCSQTYINRTNARFDFSSNERNPRFHCELDDVTLPDCVSPRTFMNLSEGPHTIRVSVEDEAGNLSPANTCKWEVDTKPPSILIIDPPPATSTSPSATFKFESDDRTATYNCRLNNSHFERCNNPHTFYNMSDGRHTLEVRAIDMAGNMSPVEKFSWAVTLAKSGCAAPGGDPQQSLWALVALLWLAVRGRERLR